MCGLSLVFIMNLFYDGDVTLLCAGNAIDVNLLHPIDADQFCTADFEPSFDRVVDLVHLGAEDAGFDNTGFTCSAPVIVRRRDLPWDRTCLYNIISAIIRF